MKTWENYFENLLNADKAAHFDHPRIKKIFNLFTEIESGKLSQEEVHTAARQRKNGKVPGIDGLPPEFWKMPEMRKSLLLFCKKIHGNLLKEWGISGLIPIPK